MKASKYNRFFKSDSDEWLAFNGMTGALAKLDSHEKYLLTKEILAAPNQAIREDETVQELWPNLVKGGYLIEESVDELALLKIRNRIGRFRRKGFGLTILPTLDCNFRCTYCYQEHHNKTMDQKVVEALVKFTKERVPFQEHFSVTWFGGEPLLQLKLIQQLTKEFKEICQEKESTYSASIITNGFLLTKQVAKKLHEAHIGFAQITLDGPKQIHDQKRFLSNGLGTYDRIIKNIKTLVSGNEEFPPINISIRVNVDKNNFDTVPLLLDDLEQQGLKDKVGVYVAQVSEYTDVCSSIGGSCFNDQDYSAVEVQLYRQFLERGFKVTKYPIIRYGYCTADSANSFVVGPDGRLYACWSDAGTDNVIGHLLEETPGQYHRRLTEYLSWDPFEKSKCLECDILPLCMGGCPYMALRNGLTAQGDCEIWKDNLEEMLQIYYTSRNLS